jgi:hypothetical protein
MSLAEYRVIYYGQIVDTLPADQADKSQLGMLMAGSSKQN